MLTPDQTMKDLFQQMADLSKSQCEKDCFKIRGHIGGCCDKMYCDIAIKHAAENGLVIEPTGNPNLPCMGEAGCVAPAWARPMCSLHICDKSLFDEEFRGKYFTLREQIDAYQDKLYQEQHGEN